MRICSVPTRFVPRWQPVSASPSSQLWPARSGRFETYAPSTRQTCGLVAICCCVTAVGRNDPVLLQNSAHVRHQSNECALQGCSGRAAPGDVAPSGPPSSTSTPHAELLSNTFFGETPPSGLDAFGGSRNERGSGGYASASRFSRSAHLGGPWAAGAAGRPPRPPRGTMHQASSAQYIVRAQHRRSAAGERLPAIATEAP
jgi:hypothetical protein